MPDSTTVDDPRTLLPEELSARAALRQTIVAAAVRIVARQGSRNLTSCAVDAEADVPAGTTEALIGTRDEAISAVVDALFVASGDTWLTVGSVAPRTVEDFAGQVTAWIKASVAEDTTNRARLELSLAEPVRSAVSHRGFTEMMTVMLDVLGVSNAGRRARLVLDFSAGVLVNAMTVSKGEPLDEAAIEAAVLRMITGRLPA